MIIQNIKMVCEEQWTKLQADISWRNKEEKVFFAVPIGLSNYIDETLVDPFVMAFVQIATKYDEDIIVKDAYITKSLAKKIETILIPSLAKMGCGTGKSQVISSYRNSQDNIDKKMAATGISLGVDSFYSILSNLNTVNKTNPINVTVYIHQVDDWNSFYKSTLEELLKPRREVAQNYGLDLIPIVSNVRHVMEQELVFGQFHTFCHVGSVAALKKKIGVYYYATGYTDGEMILNFSDSAYYENIIREAFTCENFKMISSGSSVTRFEKTKYITNDLIVLKYLDVCYHDRDNPTKYINCSRCPKCYRTMATLDVIGKLDKYRDVFDIAYYKKHRAKCWADLRYRQIIGKNHFSTEIFEAATQYGYKIPLLHWFYFLLVGLKNQINKLK